MNTFNVDYAGDLLRYNRRGMYPDWVKRERFYNCENFSQYFTGKKLPLYGLLKNKAAR
ncbi:MAG: hypothetical protein PUF13_08020 [Lachnospiraceae bacterium]|nr:hypothetical protein [Lachnospiraceae bacterium]